MQFKQILFISKFSKGKIIISSIISSILCCIKALFWDPLKIPMDPLT